MAKANLGRLERVDLRTVWDNEAGSFTPWLAQADNLALLGETLGLDLELESTEKHVGPFRADILCKDTVTDAWVLVENQLEETDHKHLGQLLTYAAGLDAVTIVWVAPHFTDEHRATLDWLNEITDERFRFFGLEIELWRIGGSPAAPKFNIVSQPNNWSRNVTSLAAGELSETRQLQLEYWTQFTRVLASQGKTWLHANPRPAHDLGFAVGRGNFTLMAVANTRDQRIGVSLLISGPEAKAHFALLRRDQAAIEKEMGTGLAWEEVPNRTRRVIALRRPHVDPSNQANWPEQHQWLLETLDRFYAVFPARVQDLDADEYSENEPPEGLV